MTSESEVLFTSFTILNNTSKMATQTRFAEISFEKMEEMEEIKDKGILENSKHATKCGVKDKQFSN